MNKLKLQLDDLVVDSFVTSEGGPAAGTVLAQGSGVGSANECTCAYTCEVTCPNTCWPGCNPPGFTEAGFETCNGWTCDVQFCGPTRVDTCPPTEADCVTMDPTACVPGACGGGGTDGFDTYCGETCAVQCGTY